MGAISADAIAELRAAGKSVAVGGDFAIDLASKQDLAKMLKDSQPYRRKIMAGNSGIVNAQGIASFRVFDVPDNFIFSMGKFIAWGDAHAPNTASVYTNAAAWGGLFHGQPGQANLAEFWPYPEASTGQVLPFTHEYGALQAPEWRPPDNIYFQGVGLTVGENITILLFGLLSRVSWA